MVRHKDVREKQKDTGLSCFIKRFAGDKSDSISLEDGQPVFGDYGDV